jgi:FAD/FMN-containing dehydrogenase
LTHIDSPLGASPLAPNIAPERIYHPGAPGYANCTRLWNGAVTRCPAVVVQPTSHAEVQSVVRYARDRGVPVAVRGGGHDWAGRSLLDDGVVIDMSLM